MPLSCSSLYFQFNAAQYLAISAPPHGAHYLYPQPSPAQPSPAQPAQLSPAWCVADLYQLSPVPSPTLPGAGTWLHAGTSVGAVCSGSLLFLYYARYPQPEQKVVGFNVASRKSLLRIRISDTGDPCTQDPGPDKVKTIPDPGSRVSTRVSNEPSRSFKFHNH